MDIIVLKSKITYAVLTGTQLHYEGSITIDEDILDRAHIRPYEQVQIVNINNGERLITYAIKGERGSGIFELNGPAARRGYVGDTIMILSYAQIKSSESLTPIIVNLKQTLS